MAGLTVFRVIKGSGAVPEDFDSQMKLGTISSVTETDVRAYCQAHACSVFSDVRDARSILALPKFKKTHKGIATLVLTDDAGPALWTRKSHYAWWIKEAFDPIANIIETQNVA